MSEGKRDALQIQLRASCNWPSCTAGCVEWRMRLDPKAPKPEETWCPLCGKVMQIRSVMPLTATNT
jgi:hypothetical protein